MFVDGRRSGRDDLLFYVKYNHNSDSDTIEVLRRDSKTLPRSVALSYSCTYPCNLRVWLVELRWCAGLHHVQCI